MALRKIGRYYYSYFRDENGKLRTYSTKCTIKTEAEAIDRANMLSVRLKRSARAMLRSNPEFASKMEESQSQEVRSIRLDKMFDEACKYRSLSRRHREAMIRFVKWSGKRFADEITPQMALRYLEVEFGGMSSKTYNNNKVYLNTIFKLLQVQTGKKSPFSFVLSKRKSDDARSRRNFSRQEYHRIRRASPIEWKFLVMLSWHTGMPKEVCLSFCPSMLTEINGVLWAKYLRGKTSRFNRHCQVPLNRVVRTLIQFAGTPSTPDTPYVDNIKKIPIKQRDVMFGKILRSLGITDTDEGIADFHSLRSSFITRCDEAGIPRHAIQSMVGHVSEKTTSGYSHDNITPLEVLNMRS